MRVLPGGCVMPGETLRQQLEALEPREPWQPIVAALLDISPWGDREEAVAVRALNAHGADLPDRPVPDGAVRAILTQPEWLDYGTRVGVLHRRWPGRVVVDALRAVAGRRWDRKRGVNTFPKSSVGALRAVAGRFGWDVPDWLVDAAEQPVAWIGAKDGQFLIRAEWGVGAEIVDVVRLLTGRRWSANEQLWHVPYVHVDAVRRIVQKWPVTVDDTAAVLLTEYEQRDTDVLTAEGFRLRDGFGVDLFPYQTEGVAYTVGAFRDGGVMIADEMGLGKTMQALAVAHHLELFPMVVVCPAVMRWVWVGEVERALRRSVQVLTGLSASAPLPADVYVVNYDVLHAWLGVLVDEIDPALVVFDESHYVKNRKARRSKAAVMLAETVLKAGGRTLALTGTPALNHPQELWPQLRVIGRAKQFGAWKPWQDKPEELNEALRGLCYVRRRKVEVLKELPELRWSTVRVPGSTDGMRRYEQAEKDFIRFLLDEFGPVEGRERALRARSAELLVKFGVLRRLAAEAKLGQVREFVSDLLAAGEKVVVFGWHREVLAGLVEMFSDVGAVLVDGAVDPGVRAEYVDRFQSEPGCRVFVGSIRAVGVGVTLTAASNVVFAEQGWTPADMDQAVARCHRIGQRSGVVGWLLLTQNTIDERIARIIESKRLMVGKVTDGGIAMDLAVSFLEEAR